MTQLSSKEKGRAFFALGAILIVIAAIAGTCETINDRRAASSMPPAAVPIAPAPPPPVVKTVKSISTPADLEFTDGGRLRLKSPDPELSGSPCVQKREIASARRLLVGRRVTIVDNPQTYGPQVTLPGGGNYSIELSKATFGDAGRCGVSYPPRSGGGGFSLGGDDDDHHSRRYCRKHRHRC